MGDVNVADVIADWHEGQGLGVRGSPHFFSGTRNVFCPALDISRDAAGDLRLQRTNEALERFLVESFD